MADLSFGKGILNSVALTYSLEFLTDTLYGDYTMVILVSTKVGDTLKWGELAPLVVTFDGMFE